MVTLYDLAIGLFQFKTSPIAGVAKEFWKTIIINEATCIYGRW
jgi:hypothetical protein